MDDKAPIHIWQTINSLSGLLRELLKNEEEMKLGRDIWKEYQKEGGESSENKFDYISHAHLIVYMYRYWIINEQIN